MGYKSQEISFYQEIENEDTQLNEENFQSKLMTIPNLHSKWLKFCYGEINVMLKMEYSLKKLYRQKYKYYLTEYEVEIKPNHINFFIESDKEYSKYLYKTNVQKKKVEYLEKVVKKINSLSFDIQNIVKWQMFKMGVN